VTVIPPGRIGDRFVAIFMTVTLVMLGAMVVLFILLLLRVSAVQGGQRADNITSCQESNASRTDDVDLWEQLLTLPPGASAAQKAVVTRDLAKVHRAYALRDCAAEYDG
jgi:hypothetical protein